MRSIIGGLLLFGLASVTACGGDSGVGDSSNDATVSSNTKGLYIIQVVSQFDDFGNAVDVDAAGNIYIGGYVGDVLPGHVNVGRTDGFIRKYDSALNEMWTRQLGTDNNDNVRGIAVSTSGNVYAVGDTIGEFDGFDSEYFGADAFLTAYGPDGTELWTHQFGTELGTVAETVSVDSSENVYVAGYTEGSLPGFSNSGGPSIGAVKNWNDAFVRKFDNNGNELWTQQFGHERHDEIHGSVADDSGNIFVTGYTYGEFTGFTNTGGRDLFVRKYDPQGNEVWTNQFGSVSASGSQPNDKGLGIALDKHGNTFVVGSSSGKFGGQKSEGINDGFVQMLDENGEQAWARQFGGDDDDAAESIGIDSAGNLFIVGTTESKVRDGRGNGLADAFVLSYDSVGNKRWVKQFGTRRKDGGRSIAVDHLGNVYIVGGTEGEISSDVDKGNDRDSDAFLIRLTDGG